MITFKAKVVRTIDISFKTLCYFFECLKFNALSAKENLTHPESQPDSPFVARMKRKASILVIFLSVFIDLIGFGIVLPLLPGYAKDNFRPEFSAKGLVIGGSTSQVGNGIYHANRRLCD